MAETDPAQPEVVQKKSSMNEKQERTWAMFCHLSALVGYFFPFGNIIAPLIIWQIKKSESEFVDDQGKESVNFQITMSIVALVAIPLVFVIIGALLLVALAVFELVMVIIATIKANEGERYRYPISIRFIK